MRHFAVIAVKERSERLPDKNFRPFHRRKSLLEVKIEQLLSSTVYEEVFISSNSQRARALARKYGVAFLDRKPEYCNNRRSWSEVVTAVVSSVPVPMGAVLSWCQVTSPLFRNFRGAAGVFERLPPRYNGLFTVGRLQKFILDGSFRPVNYQWGRGHKHSQDLPPYYFVSGALFMARKRELLDAGYFIPSRPYALETSDLEALDIDTPLDFDFARSLFRRQR